MAAISFEYACSRQNGFAMDPNQHTRIGYLTSIGGFGLRAALNQDLTVALPFSSAWSPSYPGLQYQSSGVAGSSSPSGGSGTSGAIGIAKVVAVLEKFSWEGGVSGPISFDLYLSQMNATLLKTAQQSTLTKTVVNSLGWWIADYDQQSHQWFEQAFPLGGTVNGVVGGTGGPGLNVDLTPVQVKDGVDVNVYKVSLKVAPAANASYSLRFANSPSKPIAKSWGLSIGVLSSPAPY